MYIIYISNNIDTYVCIYIYICIHGWVKTLWCLVNIKTDGKWTFLPRKLVCFGSPCNSIYIYILYVYIHSVRSEFYHPLKIQESEIFLTLLSSNESHDSIPAISDRTTGNAAALWQWIQALVRFRHHENCISTCCLVITCYLLVVKKPS